MLAGTSNFTLNTDLAMMIFGCSSQIKNGWTHFQSMKTVGILLSVSLADRLALISPPQVTMLEKKEKTDN